MIKISEFLQKDIRFVTGVGEARAKQFNKIGVYVAEDILYYFPRNYEDRTKIKNIIELVDGETICIKGMAVSKVAESRIRKGLTLYKLLIRDTTEAITATWYNQKYVANRIKLEERYVFYGKVSVKFGKKEIINPIFEEADSNQYTQKIVPVYPLTASMTQKVVQNIVGNCLKAVDQGVQEFLPHWVRGKYMLAEINYALKNIHFPEDYHSFMKARRRFVFEELFLLQLGLFRIRHKSQQLEGIPFKDVPELQGFINRLPFSLTEAQQKVLMEIQPDLKSGKPMNRLVQGDVGSGKTVIAMLTMYMSVKNGYQAALMAPTEILAEQHYKGFSDFFAKENMKICLLTGSMTKKQKKTIMEDIKAGSADIIIGTHALIQEQIEFYGLGLVVTDEQHRFGVKQRATLASKGKNPHVLVMTATPIPRTLALILYGDLDISIIDQLPPGRKKVETYSIDDSKRKRLYDFLRKQIAEGRQGYIVCPLIEESEAMQVKSAVQYAKNLKESALRECNIGLLHGKISAKEKEGIMRNFMNGDIDILVSTTVIEVGVDVPNATIMVIENAERFGLSQLHQLRGRVGRGQYQSYCILFNDSKSKVSRERMKIMQETNDGFRISEKDLQLRGPGEFFGTRQHGLPDLKIANLFSDMDILKLAQEAANHLLEIDADLLHEEHRLLRQRLMKVFDSRIKDLMLN